jgi:glycosyltransferase involved in cell wall biosynthesis
MTDTVSVAMCTYNGSRFLSAQLESIASQTRLPDEVVVCDDGSSDNTVEIVKRFSASAPFPVRLEINKTNLGSTKNFEKAIGLCTGNLIALADQDDVWLEKKLETIEKEFESKPKVGIVFSDAELVDENLQPLGTRLWTSIRFDENGRRELKSERRLNVLLPGWTVTGATMAFRLKFRTLALPIPNDVPMIHDGWIAVVIATVADISFIEQPLVKYRQHEQQQIGAPEATTRQEPTGVEGVRHAVNRTNPYDRMISIAEKVRSRIVERSEEFDCSAALRNLDEHIHHFRTRSALPENKLKRLPLVLREVASRRYHLYSNGLHSAVKDLLT